MISVLYGVMIALGLVSVAGFSKARWWFSVLDFFHLQYAACALLIGVYALWVGAWLLAGLGVLIIAINLYRMRSLMPRSLKPYNHKNKDVMSVNAHDKNKRPEKLDRAIKEADPSVLLIMELTEDIRKYLRPSLSRYPHCLQTPVRDGFSICLLSKEPLEETGIDYLGPDETPLLKGNTRINGKLYRIYSAHPKPALSKEWSEVRNEYFARLGQEIRSSGLPTHVLGDFNSVLWEQHFRSFLDKAELESTLQGHGYKVTWPVYLLPLGIPMDHILVSKDIAYSKVSVGPYVGSDHFPVSINL
jgi:endonuclease/exonuclease/phosphatase (EEP) superfamily protein YafD